MRIVEGGLEDSRVIALLRAHLLRARAETAEGSAHAFDPGELDQPALRFWSCWDGEELLGVGALRLFGARQGEIKSMHVAETHRRRGVGKLLLAHIVNSARQLGLATLYLETGSWPYFAPARSLYAAAGFIECPHFGDYRADPNSVFFRLDL